MGTALMRTNLQANSPPARIVPGMNEGRAAYLNRAAAVPVSPRDARKAVIKPPGDSTALNMSRMYAKDAGRMGCLR